MDVIDISDLTRKHIINTNLIENIEIIEENILEKHNYKDIIYKLECSHPIKNLNDFEVDAILKQIKMLL